MSKLERLLHPKGSYSNKKPANRRISHFIQSPFLMGIGSSDGKEGRTSRRCLSNADTSCSVLIERNGHRKGRGERAEGSQNGFGAKRRRSENEVVSKISHVSSMLKQPRALVSSHIGKHIKLILISRPGPRRPRWADDKSAYWQILLEQFTRTKAKIPRSSSGAA